MKLASLKETTFAALFAHVPPLEARDKCSTLPGQADLWFDAWSWREYVARRYRRKYAVNRPDLTTADEWFNQAILLEEYFKAGEPRWTSKMRDYTVTSLPGQLGLIRSMDDYRAYAKADPKTRSEEIERIGLHLVGLPVVKSPNKDGIVVYACHFNIYQTAAAEDEVLEDIDDRHPRSSSLMFESPELCHQWFLELLVPYYFKYTGLGYALKRATSYYFGPDNPNYDLPLKKIRPNGNLEDILSEMDVIFKTSRFEYSNTIYIILEDGIEIKLSYIPATIA